MLQTNLKPAMFISFFNSVTFTIKQPLTVFSRLIAAAQYKYNVVKITKINLIIINMIAEYRRNIT